VTLGFVGVVALMTGGAFPTAHHREAGVVGPGADDARLEVLEPRPNTDRRGAAVSGASKGVRERNHGKTGCHDARTQAGDPVRPMK
jgi:hypothetical protein